MYKINGYRVTNTYIKGTNCGASNVHEHFVTSAQHSVGCECHSLFQKLRYGVVKYSKSLC